MTYQNPQEAFWTEIAGWRRDWPLLALGLVAAYVDGIVIAQCLDWINAGHRLSIWVLL